MKTFIEKQQRHFLFVSRHFFSSQGTLRSDLEKFLLTCSVLLIAILCAAVFIGIHSFTGTRISLWVDISVFVCLSVTYFLLIKGYVWQGKVVGTVVCNLFVVLNASLEGRESGYQYMFFPIVTGVLVVFNNRERIITHLCLVFVFGCIVFLEVTNYSIFNVAPLPEKKVMLNSMASLLFSVMLVYVYVLYIVSSNHISFEKLKKLNWELRHQKRSLEKVNMELDFFVYKASHDLRAPLSSVLGLIDLMKEEEQLSEIKQYLNYQEKSIHKLDTYILSMLTISRNARVEISIQEIRFDDLFNEIWAHYAYLSNSIHISREVKITQQAPFYSDLTRVAIIFNNLIGNSIRYADLHKPNPVIRLSIDSTETEALISIEDNGTGIRPEFMDKIYTMFFRAAEYGTEAGAGLGLYIVKETLNRLNGSIRVESVFQEYTRFLIVIPNLIRNITAPKPLSHP
jgi:signal transduction histidine kinase